MNRVDYLKRPIPLSGQEGLLTLTSMATGLEENIYTSATSQTDYLRKISLKILAIERSAPQPDPGNIDENPADSESEVVQAQVPNQDQQLPMLIMGNPSQAQMQLSQQNIQNNTTTTGMQNSASSSTAARSAVGMASGYFHMSQMTPSYIMCANSQLSGRRQQLITQQCQQIQNSQQLLYRQPLQHGSPQQPKNEYLDKPKFFSEMLENLLRFLRLNKNDIQIAHGDKIGALEEQIVSILNSDKSNQNSSLSQGQRPQSSMQQTQQSQIFQMQPHERQTSYQMQSSKNGQGSVVPMQHDSLKSLQHNLFPSANINTCTQQSMVNSCQLGSGLDVMQDNAQGSMQHVALCSIQKHPISASQQMNLNPIASQSGMNTMLPNLNPQQQNSDMIQHQQLKQMQHILESQQRQFQQLCLHRQQMLQQQQQFLPRHLQQLQQQQTDQQQKPAQVSPHNMSSIYQTNGESDLNTLQQMGVSSAVLEQNPPASQCSYHHPPLQFGTSVIASPSPQVSQHLSPQFDQQVMPNRTPQGRTPFTVPSPSTSLAPSPMLVETAKINTSVSPLSHTGAIVHQQPTVPTAPAQSLAIGTPGISASPLLADTESPDGTQGVRDGKSTAVEQPHEHLMRAVKSSSSKSLTAAVRDIRSVASIVDRIEESTPGNGSRAAVGENLGSKTKGSPQESNFFVVEGPPESKKMRLYTSATPSNVVFSTGSVHDSFRQINSSEASDSESTATSCVKRPLVEDNHALVEEMRGINRQLVETTIEISNEDIVPSVVASAAEVGEGTIVKCSYNAVALSPNLKAPIDSLWLLVPKNYPHCSPILLNKFPVEVSTEYEDDLSMKANSKLSLSLRSLSEPMSLADIAHTWDVCAREVITEYAHLQLKA